MNYLGELKRMMLFDRVVLGKRYVLGY